MKTGNMQNKKKKALFGVEERWMASGHCRFFSVPPIYIEASQCVTLIHVRVSGDRTAPPVTPIAFLGYEEFAEISRKK